MTRNTVTIGQYVNTDVEVEVEFTREELIEALYETGWSPDLDVKDFIRKLEQEAEATQDFTVRNTLRLAVQLAKDTLS